MFLSAHSGRLTQHNTSERCGASISRVQDRKRWSIGICAPASNMSAISCSVTGTGSERITNSNSALEMEWRSTRYLRSWHCSARQHCYLPAGSELRGQRLRPAQNLQLQSLSDSSCQKNLEERPAELLLLAALLPQLLQHQLAEVGEVNTAQSLYYTQTV